ncbi:MAG: flagellar export chaperone FliS [Granulosicoccus sp.]
MMMSHASNAYGAVHRATLIEGASPHELTSLLYQSAISRVNMARVHLDRKNRTELHRSLDKTLAIVHELQGSLLDPENDELSSQLFGLYTYVTEQLLIASRNQDDTCLASALDVLVTLHDAWMQISPESQPS